MQNQTLKRLVSSVAMAVMATAAQSAIALAGTIRHDRPDSVYQQYGQQFHSVGFLSTFNGYASSSCSGTLIGSQWVLTAAHCIADYASGFFANRASFSVGSWTYSVTGAVVTGEWTRTGGSFYYGGDLALLQLNRHVWDVAPSGLYTGRNEVGQIGTYVGFGSTGNGYTGGVYRSSTKRAGDNAVDAASGSNNRLLYTDFDNPEWPYQNRTGSPYALDWEYTTARGDSGGALFIAGLLAGIVSSGDRNSAYGDLASNTRVSSWAGAIASYIASFSGYNSGRLVNRSVYATGSSGSGGYRDGGSTLLAGFDDIPEFEIYEDNFGVEPVPEPVTVFGSFLALGGLSLMRRRQQALKR